MTSLLLLFKNLIIIEQNISITLTLTQHTHNTHRTLRQLILLTLNCKGRIMSPTTYQTLNEQMNEYYQDNTNLNEVCDYIDSIQHSEAEFEALKDLMYHIHVSKHTDEYEPFHDPLVFGGFAKDTRDKEYTEMLDRQEILGDMYAFEDENESHSLFAQNPWETRSHVSDYDKTNKRSEVTIDAQVTHVGNNYSTATSKYGKVFIPKPCGLNLQPGFYGDKNITVMARFQGFDGCRKASMPWRAIAIIEQSVE